MSIVRKDGFGFYFDTDKCEMCGGKCCTGKEGYVFVSAYEMLEIAKMLDMEFEEFTGSFVRKVGYRYSFVEKPCDDGLACVFYNEGKCGIWHNSVLIDIARRHGKTVGNVVLRWLNQRGIVVIPKTVRRERMIENLNSFDFTLTPEEMDSIACLDARRSPIYDDMDLATVKGIGTYRIHE